MRRGGRRDRSLSASDRAGWQEQARHGCYSATGHQGALWASRLRQAARTALAAFIGMYAAARVPAAAARAAAAMPPPLAVSARAAAESGRLSKGTEAAPVSAAAALARPPGAAEAGRVRGGGCDGDGGRGG